MSIRKQLFGSKKRKRLSIFLIVLGCCFVIGIFFSRWANKSVSTPVFVPNAAADADAQASYQLLNTTYFVTKVPSGFRIEQSRPPGNQTRLNVVAFSITDGEQVAFVTDLLPSGGLTNVGDYHLRTSDTVDYAPLSSTSFPAGSVGFQSTSATAMDTVFMTHAGRYVSVTVSDGASSELFSLLKSTLGYWSWT